MRVALVIERFEPYAGGVEAVAWTVAHLLARAGDEVHVFARRIAAGADAALRPHLLAVPFAWQPLRVLAFSRAAAAAAPRRRFDVVQSFSRTRHQDVFRAGGGCHAVYLERSHSRLGARLRRASPRHAVLLAMERAVFGDASQLVLCNSEMARREIAERHAVPPDRFVVLPNGVDCVRFHPHAHVEAAASLRRELSPGAERVWLLVGSGFRRKGVDIALAALAASADSGAVLWVAGADAPGPWQRLALQLGVAERVRFLGRRDDLPRVYAAADAFLLPTRYDAFANSCLEAAASGLPVVTSATNGAAEWVGDGGRVVASAEDSLGFAAAMAALGGREAREAMGAAARRRAEAASWEAHARALRDLYQRVKQ